MTSGISFFALYEDLEPLLDFYEKEIGVTYFKYGPVGSDEEPMSWFFCRDIPGFGTARHGNQALESMYLILPKDTSPVIRSVPQKRGGERCFIDQEANPQSVVIQPGGQFSEDAVIAGRVSTTSNDPWSQMSYGLLSRKLNPLVALENPSIHL